MGRRASSESTEAALARSWLMRFSGARTVGSSAIFRGMPRIRTMIQMGFSLDC